MNGGLFAGSKEVPRFSRIARSLFLHAGRLEWTKINPDIFGSMIQAVAETDERANLGMHYTSVPNILKVLNPLFLDSLREQLDAGRDNPRKLLNLRKRLSNIRVFDPACGSGNFLVIAYREMREIEAEIIRLRGDADKKSWIKLTNFFGIEIKGFSAEIARLALLIAEFQLDARLIGQQEAILDVLPLKKTGQIHIGNALEKDWLSVCPPIAAEADIETFICANPPYQGSMNQTAAQKADMARIFSSYLRTYKDLDYVAAFLVKAAEFNLSTGCYSAFVTTNSVVQGEQVGMLWPIIYSLNNEIEFAHTSFKWSNLAANKAGVTCVIICISSSRRDKEDVARRVDFIGPYLIPNTSAIVIKRNHSIHSHNKMDYGNKPSDGGNFIISVDEAEAIISAHPSAKEFIKDYVGAREFIQGRQRRCVWVPDNRLSAAMSIEPISHRIEAVRRMRSSSRGTQAQANANNPHRFVGYSDFTVDKGVLTLH